ncbi:flagellar motor switch protein FliN [bacterium]|nr:flagellar motor switch protein FliN [bacterium]
MRDMEFLKDIPLVVSVEVGRTKQTIGELLSLGSGSIVELEKLAGEPLEIFVNQKLVARGEAVIVNEKFGVRLTDVVSHSERLENLKQ